jgi:DNA-binding beta-propeller fold protein YncE
VNSKKHQVVGIALTLLSSLALAAEAKFAKRPTATKTGNNGRTTIQFTVSELTDVEVAVLDAGGKVIRHLAAGIVGERAAPPLKKGLAQSLEWDGKDDLGKPASGGPFKVRVALGMKPTFGKLIGDNPGGLGYVPALAAGPKGTLYVFNNFSDLHPGDGSTVIQAYDRSGKYLRQVAPYAANTPGEKLKGLKQLDVDGKKVPYIYNGETRSLIPGLGQLPRQRAVVTSEGKLAFVGHHESGYKLTYNAAGPQWLTVIGIDGSAPRNIMRLKISKSARGGAQLGLSPDEKTIYIAGVLEGKQRLPAVFKCDWNAKQMKLFAGSRDKAGSGADGLNGPTSVDTDANGNVYVSDKGNNRVAVFDPAGKYLGELKVDAPRQVCVHRTTGAVYVLGSRNCAKLSKFKSWKEAKPVLTTAVRTYKHRSGNYWMPMVLDDSAEPAVLWLGCSTNWAGYKCLRIEDTGTSFSKATDLARLPGNNLPNAGPRRRYNLYTAGAIYGMALDRKNQKLLLNKRAYDLKSGKWSKGFDVADGCKEGAGSFGLDGNYYAQVQVWKNIWVRYSPAGKPLPFPGSTAKNGGIDPKGSFRLRGRGITADPLGNIYSLQQSGPRKPGDAKDANNLAKYGPDGKLINGTLIGSSIRSLNSVRLDYAGNIWVGIGARPAGRKVPKHLEGQELGKVYHHKKTLLTTDFDWYPFMYGTIAKFSPKGGEVRSGIGGVKMDFSTGGKVEVKGAQWTFFGASPMPSWRLRYPNVCLCESPRFDVDGYGRCFFPDAAGFRVGVLDTGGTLLKWFGSYGNVDSAGPDSKVPTPEIAFHWPYSICADDRVVYIGDRLNRRVTVVKLNYAAEETVAIK